MQERRELLGENAIGGGGEVEGQGAVVRVEIDPERNEALEKERPGDAVFRAIFGSEDEDEDEDEGDGG